MSANPYHLAKGAHNTGDDGRCAMEWVAWIAGEPHTDQPVCVDQPLKSFCISFNDALDDEDRQRLRPYLARSIGTAGDGRTSERGYLCLDWIIRTYMPTWLDLADLHEDAGRLRALPAIIDLATAEQATPVVQASSVKAAAAGAAAWAAAGDAAWAAAGDAAWAAAGAAAWAAAGAAAWDAARDAAWAAAGAAAWDAAGDAAGAAARDAAWAAAGDAARDAARAAAGAAAWDAAGAAARDAARDAAREALASTVKALQGSAFDLLDRMLPKVMLDLPEPAAAKARKVCA